MTRFCNPQTLWRVFIIFLGIAVLIIPSYFFAMAIINSKHHHTAKSPVKAVMDATLTQFNYTNSVVKSSVMDAILTQFNYTNNTLYYNLTLNILLPHTVHYDYINVNLLYQNVTFGSQTVDILNRSFTLKGQHLMALSTNQISELNKETTSGVFHINVKLCPRFRSKTNKHNPMHSCDLQVPLKSRMETPLGSRFHAAQCNLRYDHDDMCSLM